VRSTRIAYVSFSVLLCAAAIVFAPSCKKAQLEDAPDANISCNPGAHVFCAPDAATGCPVQPNDPEKHLAKLPPGTYATGCVANFVAEDRDIGGDCVVEAICRCSEPTSGDGGVDQEGGIPAHWTCFP
jgi:hypothetical protein